MVGSGSSCGVGQRASLILRLRLNRCQLASPVEGDRTPSALVCAEYVQYKHYYITIGQGHIISHKKDPNDSESLFFSMVVRGKGLSLNNCVKPLSYRIIARLVKAYDR